MSECAPRRTERILVVEDEDDTARLFEEIMVSAGYEVSIAEDGYDALEKIASGTYDLITMDLKMPRMDGLQATELIRMDRRHTPIIIISGFVPAFSERLRDPKLQIQHILHKPVTMEDLLAKVRSTLENGGAASQQRSTSS